MLIIKIWDVEAIFNDLKDKWECKDKDLLKQVEKHWKDLSEEIPYNEPYMARRNGGYFADKLGRIYGNHVVKVLLNIPSFIPTYNKDGNIKKMDTVFIGDRKKIMRNVCL